MADGPPPPPPHHHHQYQHQHYNAAHKLQSDGASSRRPHRELGIDLAAVAAKLRELPTANFAMDSLREHYSDVFGLNQKSNSSNTGTRNSNNADQHHYQQQHHLPPPPTQQQSTTNTHLKAYINYVDEREVYIINVPTNTARVVKSLAPKRGNYRYFFELEDGAYEEIEPQGDTKVPIHQRDNGASKCIRCKVFNA